MIYTTISLKNKYLNISNINQKISLEIKKSNYTRIKKGLYTDSLTTYAPIIANICYEPSYISFKYALYYYGLIPKYVSIFTSACFNKKNNKTYILLNAIFEYRSIPNEVFNYGIIYKENENGIKYKLAKKEKSLCDILYSSYPVRSIKNLKILLFENLRINEIEFYNLDFDFINEITPLYHLNTLNTLIKYIKGEMKNDKSN